MSVLLVIDKRQPWVEMSFNDVSYLGVFYVAGSPGYYYLKTRANNCVCLSKGELIDMPADTHVVIVKGELTIS